MTCITPTVCQEITTPQTTISRAEGAKLGWRYGVMVRQFRLWDFMHRNPNASEDDIRHTKSKLQQEPYNYALVGHEKPQRFNRFAQLVRAQTP